MYSLNNVVEGCSPRGGPNFSAKGPKKLKQPSPKKTYFFKLPLWTRRMQFSGHCRNFCEEAENSFFEICGKYRVPNFKLYTLSSKWSSGDVECSFDEHVKELPGKAYICPFRFQNCSGRDFLFKCLFYLKLFFRRRKTRFSLTCRKSFCLASEGISADIWTTLQQKVSHGV